MYKRHMEFVLCTWRHTYLCVRLLSLPLLPVQLSLFILFLFLYHPFSLILLSLLSLLQPLLSLLGSRPTTRLINRSAKVTMGPPLPGTTGPPPHRATGTHPALGGGAMTPPRWLPKDILISSLVPLLPLHSLLSLFFFVVLQKAITRHETIISTLQCNCCFECYASNKCIHVHSRLYVALGLKKIQDTIAKGLKLFPFPKNQSSGLYQLQRNLLTCHPPINHALYTNHTQIAILYTMQKACTIVVYMCMALHVTGLHVTNVSFAAFKWRTTVSGIDRHSPTSC